jgi:hypothetical protein
MHSVDTRVSDMVILGALQKINLYTNMKISWFIFYQSR